VGTICSRDWLPKEKAILPNAKGDRNFLGAFLLFQQTIKNYWITTLVVSVGRTFTSERHLVDQTRQSGMGMVERLEYLRCGFQIGYQPTRHTSITSILPQKTELNTSFLDEGWGP